MNRLSQAIHSLQGVMNEENVDPIQGLPLNLFEFSTTLLPFVNIDLLIQNDKGQVLLSWRDDKHYGKGWQLPGGIIRMMETIDERIQKTALEEIGCKVIYDKNPIRIGECIIHWKRDGIDNQLERAHSIALLYKCTLPNDYVIDNGRKVETDRGFLRWFSEFPENLLKCHKVEYIFPSLIGEKKRN